MIDEDQEEAERALAQLEIIRTGGRWVYAYDDEDEGPVVRADLYKPGRRYGRWEFSVAWEEHQVTIKHLLPIAYGMYGEWVLCVPSQSWGAHLGSWQADPKGCCAGLLPRSIAKQVAGLLPMPELHAVGA